jgi:glycerate-2-kinase
MLFKNTSKIIENGSTPEQQTKRKHILEILTEAIQAVDPYNTVAHCFKENTFTCNNYSLSLEKFKNIYLIGFGKASIRMTQAATDTVKIHKGVIITNYKPDHFTIPQIEICIGGHPLPNQGSITGAEKIIDLLQQTTSKDLVLVLISGGGSALFCHPRIPLNELQTLTDHLLRSGADITEINTIRKHLSYIKGGQLIHYSKAPILSLILSDVVNDPLEFIASGPTAPDNTTYNDAKNILQKYRLLDIIPSHILQVIQDGITKKITDNPKPKDPIFSHVHNHIIANNTLACEAASNKAIELGYTSEIISTSLTGEASLVGPKLIDIIRSKDKGNIAFISGGETTVTLQGNGKGGRNQELILAIVHKITDTPIVAASLASDGVDGDSNDAGAVADGNTLFRGQQLNLSLDEYLKNNDSNTYFSRLHDTLTTLPTSTNIMDIQVFLL